MKPFHTIAVPHDDILKGKLTMNVFAADLWDTYLKRGPEEYSDPKTFFKKTHITKNLRHILDNVEKRLQGKGGDGYQHIETPFGGGKTHSLIAMYHSAKNWDAKTVVIVGTSMGPKDTVWGMIEKQLDGKIEKLVGNVSPGRDALREVLEKHQPVLILIDELLQYVIKAAGVEVKDTTLASQTIAFVQELSEVASTMEKVCVVASFPASIYEIADQKIAEELLKKIRRVSGRIERRITPVDPNDVPNIIRARLFSTSEKEIEQNSESIISNFVDYCEKEHILPAGKTATQYRDEFTNSYPFLPQVIDALYQRWGSFPSFQRTRGVLRLLSQVIFSLKDSNNQYITLADFDLTNNEIRRELLEHIGNQFDSVISKDITDSNSGASKVSRDIGASFRGLKLGTKTATVVFMYSFSGGEINGANMGEIKRAVAFQEIPSSIIGDVVANFKSKLFYLSSLDDRYLFTSEPNLNRLKMDKMESIKDDELEEHEKHLLESNIGKQKLRVKIWPKIDDVEDSHQLKLAIVPKNDIQFCNEILEKKGKSSRVYRNTIFFLCPSDGEKHQFIESLKSKIALEKIVGDRSLKLKETQKIDLSDELRKEKNNLNRLIRKYYRILYIPNKNELLDLDLGIPTVGENKGIDEVIYERLVSEDQVHESFGPLGIKNIYLKDQDYAKTSSMYESMLSTRGGRIRPVSKDVIENSLQRGTHDGIFGLGELVDENLFCKYFKEEPSISFADNEVIIQDSICISQIQKPEEPPSLVTREEKPSESEPQSVLDDTQNSLDFGFQIPEGKMTDVWGILRLINEKFGSIELDIKAKDGTISKNDIEKIREALKQIGAYSNL